MPGLAQSARAAGVEVVIPAVADFEVRRELIRVRARSRIRNLDLLRNRFGYVDTSQAAWDSAAGFWALVRQAGFPTAAQTDLDADAIIAGMAATAGQPGDDVMIATMKLIHFVRFPGVRAGFWAAIS
jgi:hypothetical protein